MKVLKAILSTLLSVILTVAILVTCVLHVTGALLKKDSLDAIMKEASAGERILNYSYSEDKGISKDFYDTLYDRFTVQSALTVGIFGEEAEICQQGAFDYVKSQQADTKAYASLDSLAEDLAEAYTQTAIDHGFIDPDETMTYKNVRNERVYVRKGALLKETMNTKYLNLIRSLTAEGFFCTLDLDQQQYVVYLLKTGKEAAEIEEDFHREIESEIGDIYTSQLSDFLDCLLEDGTYQRIGEDEVREDLTSALYRYLSRIDIADENIRDDSVQRKLQKSVSSYVYPKLLSYLPSYDDTVASVPKIALTGLRLLNKNYLFYAGLVICALLVSLIRSSAGKGVLGFAGLAALLSGGALFIMKFFRTAILERTASLFEKIVTAWNIIIPELIGSFITRSANIGIYVAGAGILLILLAILFSDAGRKA